MLKNDIYLDKIRHVQSGDTLPGVRNFLDEAMERGIALAVGSGSKNARPILERLGITDLFQAICDGTDISRSKPDPEVFQCAMGKLNVPGQNTVVFEDAASGIEAARAAGTHTVGIGNTTNLGAADVVYDAFTSFNVSDILNQFA